MRLCARNGNDITARYPELRELGRALGARTAILDGEIVAFDAEGRPSFERLQSRMHLANEAAVRRAVRDIPIAYVLFDVLYLDGHTTFALPYTERRALLEGLALAARTGRPPATDRGRRARCCGPAPTRASRASSPSGSTRATSPGARAAVGQGQEQAPPVRW